jgi:hypothetical protein
MATGGAGPEAKKERKKERKKEIEGGRTREFGEMKFI